MLRALEVAKRMKSFACLGEVDDTGAADIREVMRLNPTPLTSHLRGTSTAMAAYWTPFNVAVLHDDILETAVGRGG